MQILYSRLDCPQVSTDNRGSSLLPFPSFQSRTSGEVLRELAKFDDPSTASTISSRPQVETLNENCVVTYRVQVHPLGEDMDDKFPECFMENSSPQKTPAIEQGIDPLSSRMQRSSDPIVSSQGSSRKNPDDDKQPGDHYNDNRGSSSTNNKENNPNEENNEEDEEEEEDGERKMSGPFSSKHGEILRRKNKAVLIINLYPPERGYTYCCCVRELEGNDPNEIQVFKESHEIPYSETYILDCIDQETVPLRLIQKLEKVDGVNLMRYLGCVVCEIRDHRRFAKHLPKRNSPVVKKVLLKPTNHTLFSELDHLISTSIEDRKLYKKLRLENENHSPGRDQDCTTESQQLEPDVQLGESACKRPRMSTSDELGPEIDESKFDKLSLKQRLEVEKQLLLRTYSGLCLDPSKTVGLISNVRQFERFKWNSPLIKDAVRSHSNRAKESQSSQSQKVSNPRTQTEDFTEWETIFGKVHKHEDLVQFIQFAKQASKKLPERVVAERANPLDALKLPPINYIEYPAMTTPTNLEELSRIGRPAETAVYRPIMSENYTRQVDEYVLETERKKRPHSTKLSIFQRNGTESYFGELEQESFAETVNNNTYLQNQMNSFRNFGAATDANNKKPQGTTFPSTKCQFELGSLKHVQLYVRQFTDIFTEDGRRPCKITYQKVGQTAPNVMFIGDYGGHGQNRNPSNIPNNATTNNSNSNYKPNAGNPGNNGQVKPITAPPAPAPPSCPLPPPQTSGAAPVNVTATIAVVNSSASPTSTSQPPVQIVHPQPRSIQQAQTTSPQIHYSVAPQAATILQPTQSIQATGTNVNVNLNLNSARVVHQQPLLTRPQIINLNLQQSTASIVTNTNNTNYTMPKIQTPAQLHQHQQQQQLLKPPPQSPAPVSSSNSLRLKQPTLATLLLAPNPKPITVIQPQPQNPNITHSIQLGNTAAIDHQKQQQHNLQQQLSQIVHHSQQSQQLLQNQQQTGQQQPIMIITNTGGAHQQHSGSVSLNLNTISLDSLLNASQHQQNYVTTASLISPGSSNNPTMNGLNTILRFSNNNTVALTPQQQQLLRQNALSLNMNATNSGATILNPGIIINSAPNSINHQGQVISTANMSGNRNTGTATISASIGPTQQSKCSDPNQGTQREHEEMNVPDLHSLLNSAPSTSNAAFRNQSGGATATIDGLNLDLNLNLNLNLGGAPTTSPIPSSSMANQNQNQIIYDTGNNTVHHQHDGVDTLFNALSEAIGPELGQKLDGAMRQAQSQGPTNNAGMNVVTSSLSPTKSIQTSNNNSITLNDLLGSPPIMVSSTSQQANGLSPMQSPQSPSITSILSPISPNIAANPAPYSTTPRLSALLAGTPSADSSGMSNRFDPATANRGASVAATSSYGNLLDRLVASSGQSQVTQRTGGSRLNPIASATPMLASSLGGAPLNARQGSGNNGTVGLARPTAYRQIAPAPPPNRPPQPQQLINVIGYVGNTTQQAPGSTGQGQPTSIRVVNNSPQGSGGNLGNR